MCPTKGGATTGREQGWTRGEGARALVSASRNSRLQAAAAAASRPSSSPKGGVFSGPGSPACLPHSPGWPPPSSTALPSAPRFPHSLGPAGGGGHPRTAACLPHPAGLRAPPAQCTGGAPLLLLLLQRGGRQRGGRSPAAPCPVPLVEDGAPRGFASELGARPVGS